MDYSILVGVVEVSYRVNPAKANSRDLACKLPFVHTETEDNPRSHMKQANKGLRVAEGIVGPGFYYLGIVDILQSWTVAKRLERFLKIHVLRKDPDGISVMEPDNYRRRFNKKMCEIIDHDGSIIPSHDAFTYAALRKSAR